MKTGKWILEQLQSGVKPDGFYLVEIKDQFCEFINQKERDCFVTKIGKSKFTFEYDLPTMTTKSTRRFITINGKPYYGTNGNGYPAYDWLYGHWSLKDLERLVPEAHQVITKNWVIH